jgi:hypothetical protein
LWPFRQAFGAAPLAAQVCGGAVVYAAALLFMDFQGIRAMVARRFVRPDDSVAGRMPAVMPPAGEAA